MMRLILFLSILLSGSLAIAQKKVDSSINKLSTVKNVDGASMSPSIGIGGNISSSSNYSLLAKAIEADGLTDTLNSNGTFTLFAPTNKAFEKLAAGRLDTLLLPSHKAELTSLLLYHIVAGKMTSKDIEMKIKTGNGQATFITLSGGTLTARINENRNIVLTDESGRQSVISKFDSPQKNGMLQTITSVLIPHSK